MKALFKNLTAALIMLAVSIAAFADATYPISNPTYIPTATMAPAAFTTTGDYTMTTHNLSTVALRISGTCTSLVAAPQGSNDGGTNWTTINAYSVGGGSSANSLTTTGFWRINASGFNKVRLHITTLAASCTVAMSGTFASSEYAGDPCQTSTIQKLSAVINVGTATTTKLVDAVAGQTVYVCGIVGSLAGTTPSVTIKYGTKVSTDCDTGATALTGVILPTSGSLVNLTTGGGTVVKGITANQICATTVGTGSSFQGVVTYVQQ